MNAITKFFERFGIKLPYGGVGLFVLLWLIGWMLFACGAGALAGGGLLLWWLWGM